MRLLFVFLAALCIHEAFGQSSFSEKEQKVLAEAKASFEAGDYTYAALFYDSLLAFHPESAELNHFAGLSRYHLRNRRDEALPFLENSARSAYHPSYLPVAILLHERGRLYEAGQYYALAEHAGIEEQKEELERRSTQHANALTAIQSPEAVSVLRLNASINSNFVEHTPFITYNNQELIFTSRRPINEKAVRDDNGEFDENIYIARRDSSGWGMAEPLEGNVNGLLNDAAAGLSPNGETMIVFKTARDLLTSELWIARPRGEGSWKLDEKLPSPLNSDFIEAGISISSDGTTIIVSSDRPGGYGGMDLYRIVRFANGEYSLPVNLGPAINSAADEVGPYFLADGKTLYFSSNRKESIGGFDIFRCDWMDNTWQEPVNLGYPLNTFMDDLHLSVSPRGGICYFSRGNPENSADYSIYRANIPGFNMEANVIRGEVRDQKTGNPVDEAVLTLFSENFEEIKGIYPCREGRFFIVLLPGESGILEVTAPDFESLEKDIQYQEHEGIWESKKLVELQRAE